MNPILVTVENALANVCLSTATSGSLNAYIYTGLDNEEKVAPAIICSCKNATEDFPESGVWHVSADVMVKEIATDTTMANSISNTIFEKLSTITNDELQSSVSNLGVYNIKIDNLQNSTNGDAWVQTLSLDIVAVLT